MLRLADDAIRTVAGSFKAGTLVWNLADVYSSAVSDGSLITAEEVDDEVEIAGYRV